MSKSDMKRREWWVLESSRVLHTNRYHIILDKEQVSEMHDWDANWFVKPKPQYVHVVEVKPNERVIDVTTLEQVLRVLNQFTHPDVVNLSCKLRQIRDQV